MTREEKILREICKVPNDPKLPEYARFSWANCIKAMHKYYRGQSTPHPIDWDELFGFMEKQLEKNKTNLHYRENSSLSKMDCVHHAVGNLIGYIKALQPEFQSVPKQKLSEEYQWNDYKTNPPTPEMFEVIAFSPDWIDPDFNPNGYRVGFQGGEGFISAKWIDYHDCYKEDYDSQPEKWIPFFSNLSVPKELTDNTKDLLNDIISWEKDLSEYKSLEGILRKRYIITKR